MKFIFIVFQIFSLGSISQVNDINKLDSLGRKTGTWVTIPDSFQIVRSVPYSSIPNEYSLQKVENSFYTVSPRDTSDGSLFNFTLKNFESFKHAYSSKLIFRRRYDNGLLNGDFEITIGDSLIAYKGEYKDGKIEGVFTDYLIGVDKYGVTASKHIVFNVSENQLHGFSHFYSSSKLYRVLYFENGIQNGHEYILNPEKGNIKSIFHFRNGEVIDGWYTEYTYGKFNYIKIKNGRRNRVIKYDENGDIYQINKNGRKYYEEQINFWKKLRYVKKLGNLRKPYVNEKGNVVWD